MDAKPPTKPPPKFRCPYCSSRIEAPKTGEWFSCPRCGKNVRKRTTKDGSVSLEAGIVTEVVRPIEIKDQEKKTYPTILKTMPLDEVLSSRQQVDAKLSTLWELKKKIGDQINARIRENLGTEDLRDQLKQLDVQTDRLKAELEQLNSMERILLEERQAAISSADNSGSVFGCSLFMVSLGLVTLSWVSSSSWNWKMVLTAIATVLVTSMVLAGVASPRR